MPSAAPNARDAIIDAFKATTEELGREGHTLTDIYPALVDFVAEPSHTSSRFRRNRETGRIELS